MLTKGCFRVKKSILKIKFSNLSSSDMFTGLNKFSTRTMAAVGNLADQGITKRKEDYKWRKDMDEYVYIYEKSILT